MKKVLALIFAAAVLVSCSEYQRVLKSKDMNLKLLKANEYFDKKQYFKALPIYEELIAVYRGTARAALVYYKYAYCEFYLGDLIMANYRFDNFTKTFPNSEKAEECSFMAAYCSYTMSPRSSLDQSASYQAIDELNLFMTQYPESPLVDSCSYLLDQLRIKLEQKAFDSANLFLKTGNYKAAIVSFENALRDYPDTDYKEQILYHSLRAHYKLATNSVETKKEERMRETVKAYIKFADSFPESPLLRKAEDMYKLSQAELDKLSITN
jgi:outer membrane protein assembly factor BamD